MRRNRLTMLVGLLPLVTSGAQGSDMSLDTLITPNEPGLLCETSGKAWRRGRENASALELAVRGPTRVTEPWFTCRMGYVFKDVIGGGQQPAWWGRFEFGTIDGKESVAVAERLWRISLTDEVSRAVSQPPLLKPVMGGVLGSATGGLFGVFLGGAAGAYLMGGASDGQAGGEAFLGLILGGALGLIAGEPWGAACGIHMANDRRGHAPTGMAVSAVIFFAGMVAALATQDARLLIAIPVLQVATIVPIERLTAKSEPQAYSVCPDFGSERQEYGQVR